MTQFNFGKNWDQFSKKALTNEKFRKAKEDFHRLLENTDLENHTFLDIGFGQGLSLIFAAEMLAITIGNDINPLCGEVLKNNIRTFSEIPENSIPFIIGSILHFSVVNQLIEKNGGEKFDIVHSWGVLHHTGKMWEGVSIACNLVKENGYLFLAIYNKHWTSPIWKIIKYIYVKSPSFIQQIFTFLFYPIVYIAKFIATKKNPKKEKRGMDFFYDLIDWIGGYPYQYATKSEIITYLKKHGFTCERFIKAQVPTGCNEYVFRKIINK